MGGDSQCLPGHMPTLAPMDAPGQEQPRSQTHLLVLEGGEWLDGNPSSHQHCG